MLLWTARLLGLFALCRYLHRNHLVILCYHGIWIGAAPHYGDCLYMSKRRFSERMGFLQRKQYKVLSLDEALRLWEQKALPSNAVVLTIDDGWYGTYKHMVPVLEEKRFPATLYVTSYYVRRGIPVVNVLVGFLLARIPDIARAADILECALGAKRLSRNEDELLEQIVQRIESLPSLEERWQAVEKIARALEADLATIVRERWFHLMNPEELRHAREQGLDLQLHTHRHRMYDFSEAELARDLSFNRSEIVELTGCTQDSLRHFCYPSGVYDPSVFGLLNRLNIVSATTTEPGLNPPGANKLSLRRILDCESLSDIEVEARLCGFWSVLDGLGRRTQSEGQHGG
jgi:peptidoglycan/xylan/chitin deacetylase (PgdA/CDA1 family)